ncbi:MAG: hypothetical protein O2794_02035 [bacterium]|nr:hypothetical protein [bacterium]
MKENNLLDKINKLSLPAVILIASIILGGFFYASQVNKQRFIERQQQIKTETELAKELKEQQAKEEAELALNTCRANAQEKYHKRWHNECKAQGELTNKCIDIKELSYDEYLTKYELTDEEYKKQRSITDPSKIAGLLDYFERQDNECSCRLAIDPYVNLFNKGLADDKAECLRRYPQK